MAGFFERLLGRNNTVQPLKGQQSQKSQPKNPYTKEDYTPEEIAADQAELARMRQEHREGIKHEMIDQQRIIDSVNTAYGVLQADPKYGHMTAGIFIFGSTVRNGGDKFGELSDLDIGFVHKPNLTKQEENDIFSAGEVFFDALPDDIKPLIQDQERFWSSVGTVGAKYDDGIFASESVNDVLVLSNDYADDIRGMFRQE